MKCNSGVHMRSCRCARRCASSLFGVGGNDPLHLGLWPVLVPGGRRGLSRQLDTGRFLCLAGGRFFVPARSSQNAARSRSQGWPQATAERREASLTAASTAFSSIRMGRASRGPIVQLGRNHPHQTAKNQKNSPRRCPAQDFFQPLLWPQNEGMDEQWVTYEKDGANIGFPFWSVTTVPASVSRASGGMGGTDR